jgi:hypothetical protein
MAAVWDKIVKAYKKGSACNWVRVYVCVDGCACVCACPALGGHICSTAGNNTHVSSQVKVMHSIGHEWLSISRTCVNDLGA